jgi:hypothetical protein
LAQEEFLVVVLRQRKRVQRQDGRLHRVTALGGFTLTAGESEFLLCIILVEDNASILPAAGALARIRIMPEGFQQLFK